jgi:hypothetical protein
MAGGRGQKGDFTTGRLVKPMLLARRMRLRAIYRIRPDAILLANHLL